MRLFRQFNLFYFTFFSDIFFFRIRRKRKKKLNRCCEPGPKALQSFSSFVGRRHLSSRLSHDPPSKFGSGSKWLRFFFLFSERKYNRLKSPPFTMMAQLCVEANRRRRLITSSEMVIARNLSQIPTCIAERDTTLGIVYELLIRIEAQLAYPSRRCRMGLRSPRAADRATRFILEIFGHFSCCHRAFQVQRKTHRRWHQSLYQVPKQRHTRAHTVFGFCST